MSNTETPTAGGNGESDRAEMLDVSDVATRLNISTRTVRRMADCGLMPRPVRLAGCIRWRRTDLDRWIDAGCPSCRHRHGGAA